MKGWFYLVLGVILAGGTAYIYLHREALGIVGSTAQASDADQSPHPARISWTVVDRSADGFKLEMPEDTREIEVPAYNEHGAIDQVDMIYAYPDPSTSFSVSWANNPPVMRAVGEDAAQALEDARNGALARTQTVLVSEAQSTRQGFPVRDFSGRNQNGGTFNARLVLANHRLYLLMAAFPAASARRNDDVNHFFDSFHVINATHSE